MNNNYRQHLLWIWRERHRGKFLIGRMVFHAPSIKLRVTCVNVLLVVAICPSFRSGSLKTMVLIMNVHWSILSACVSCLERLRNKWVTLIFESCYTTIIVHPEWNLVFFVGVGVERVVIAYNMDSRKVHVIPTDYIGYGTCDILLELIGRPYYLPYVSLFSKLESLAK
jgi:hypothetical protein